MKKIFTLILLTLITIGLFISYNNQNVIKAQNELTRNIYNFSDLSIFASSDEYTDGILQNDVSIDFKSLQKGSISILGTKTLDLNGHKIYVTSEHELYPVTIFDIDGTTLTVKDTSEAKTGTIDGSNGKGNKIGRLFSVENGGTLTLNGGTYQNGHGKHYTDRKIDGYAGFAYIESKTGSSTLNINNAVIKDNFAAQAGALYCQDSNTTVNIVDTEFYGNKALTNSGSDGMGGAIYVADAKLNLTNVNIHDNIVDYIAGGILVDSDNVTLKGEINIWNNRRLVDGELITLYDIDFKYNTHHSLKSDGITEGKIGIYRETGDSTPVVISKDSETASNDIKFLININIAGKFEVNDNKIVTVNDYEVCSLSTAAGKTCKITNEDSLRAWAQNSNSTYQNPITGYLDDISLNSSSNTLTVNSTIDIVGQKALNLRFNKIKASNTFTGTELLKTNHNNGIYITSSTTKNIGLDGNNKARILNSNCSSIKDHDYILDNVHLSNGYVEGEGGAIFINSDCKINNVLIDNCVAEYVDSQYSKDYVGGAIYISTPIQFFTLSNSTISNCEAKNGGGGAVAANGYLTVTELIFDNCVFTNNKANYRGGALALDKFFVKLNDCIITDNLVRLEKDTTSHSLGGAIYFTRSYSGTPAEWDDTLKISGKCIIKNNKRELYYPHGREYYTETQSDLYLDWFDNQGNVYYEVINAEGLSNDSEIYVTTNNDNYLDKSRPIAINLNDGNKNTIHFNDLQRDVRYENGTDYMDDTSWLLEVDSNNDGHIYKAREDGTKRDEITKYLSDDVVYIRDIDGFFEYNKDESCWHIYGPDFSTTKKYALICLQDKLNIDVYDTNVSFITESTEDGSAAIYAPNAEVTIFGSQYGSYEHEFVLGGKYSYSDTPGTYGIVCKNLTLKEYIDGGNVYFPNVRIVGKTNAIKLTQNNQNINVGGNLKLKSNNNVIDGLGYNVIMSNGANLNVNTDASIGINAGALTGTGNVSVSSISKKIDTAIKTYYGINLTGDVTISGNIGTGIDNSQIAIEGSVKINNATDAFVNNASVDLSGKNKTSVINSTNPLLLNGLRVTDSDVTINNGIVINYLYLSVSGGKLYVNATDTDAINTVGYDVSADRGGKIIAKTNNGYGIKTDNIELNNATVDSTGTTGIYVDRFVNLSNNAKMTGTSNATSAGGYGIYLNSESTSPYVTINEGTTVEAFGGDYSDGLYAKYLKNYGTIKAQAKTNAINFKYELKNYGTINAIADDSNAIYSYELGSGVLDAQEGKIFATAKGKSGNAIYVPKLIVNNGDVNATAQGSEGYGIKLNNKFSSTLFKIDGDGTVFAKSEYMPFKVITLNTLNVNVNAKGSTIIDDPETNYVDLYWVPNTEGIENEGIFLNEHLQKQKAIKITRAITAVLDNGKVFDESTGKEISIPGITYEDGAYVFDNVNFTSGNEKAMIVSGNTKIVLKGRSNIVSTKTNTDSNGLYVSGDLTIKSDNSNYGSLYAYALTSTKTEQTIETSHNPVKLLKALKSQLLTLDRTLVANSGNNYTGISCDGTINVLSGTLVGRANSYGIHAKSIVVGSNDEEYSKLPAELYGVASNDSANNTVGIGTEGDFIINGDNAHIIGLGNSDNYGAFVANSFINNSSLSDIQGNPKYDLSGEYGTVSFNNTKGIFELADGSIAQYIELNLDKYSLIFNTDESKIYRSDNLGTALSDYELSLLKMSIDDNGNLHLNNTNFITHTNDSALIINGSPKDLTIYLDDDNNVIKNVSDSTESNKDNVYGIKCDSNINLTITSNSSNKKNNNTLNVISDSIHGDNAVVGMKLVGNLKANNINLNISSVSTQLSNYSLGLRCNQLINNGSYIVLSSGEVGTGTDCMSLGIVLDEKTNTPLTISNSGIIDLISGSYALTSYADFKATIKALNPETEMYDIDASLVEDVDITGLKCYVIKLKDNTYVKNARITKYSPKPGPSPKPDPENKSCEKVIGPTWHWNNEKGVCEETGVVKTFSR